MIETKFKVTRHYREWDTWQLLIKEWWFRWDSSRIKISFKVWSRVVDVETVPAHVYLSWLCFGDWGTWRSKFYEHIKNK